MQASSLAAGQIAYVKSQAGILRLLLRNNDSSEGRCAIFTYDLPTSTAEDSAAQLDLIRSQHSHCRPRKPPVASSLSQKSSSLTLCPV